MHSTRLLLCGVVLLPLLTATDLCAAEAAEGTPPIVITAGPDWIPLQAELEIEPGSALDFSRLGFTDAPAGKHGRVIARDDGQFAFADSPRVTRRFYGVNLCFGAQYLSAEEAERLAQRLVRLGYNAVRIHHYEGELTSEQPRSTELNPRKLEQFDHLMAACIRHGLYLTTDLYVSRSVPWREVGINRDGRIPMDTFKILVPVHDGAFENWKDFTRALLNHRNAHTGRRYAEEPALAWLAMINEGNFGNFHRDLRTFPEWTQAWNRWLAARHPDRASLAEAWGDELKPGEDAAAGSVVLPENIRDPGPRARDCILFFADTERDMIARMQRFLREELGCQALISNANSWTYFATDQFVRATYDYVDDHFYVDHPQWVEGSWRLPSKCPNTSPLAEGATGGRSKSFTRLFNQPFTITEYNYSGPGRFRGVGGILTGALGALQGWGGIWRFSYSHSRDAMFTPSRINYFDLAADPLSQAAERASLCLFLRGDLKTAPHSVVLAMTEADLQHPPDRIPSLHPRWHWLAWVTRVGTGVFASPAEAATHEAILPLDWGTSPGDYPAKSAVRLGPYAADDAAVWDEVKPRLRLASDNPTDPARKLYRSETGEITIDAPSNRLILDTPRTAGGFAPAGGSVETVTGGMSVRMLGSDATVWVSALDDRPIRRSRRLLVTHLTDLQNTDIRYREEARQTLLAWGRLPHLVRSGQAEISVTLSSPARYRVWALSLAGRRLAMVPVQTSGRTLRFTADVGGDASNGARMLYEIVRD